MLRLRQLARFVNCELWQSRNNSETNFCFFVENEGLVSFE